MIKTQSLSLLIVLVITGMASAIGGPIVGVPTFFGIVLMSAIVVGGRAEKSGPAAQRT